MKLPSVIKVKGLKLVKTETPYDISYSTVMESRSVTISAAISKAVSEARKIESHLEKEYNIVYSGFNFLTKNKLGDDWLVVIETIFTKKDYYPEMEDFSITQIEHPSEIDTSQANASAGKANKRPLIRYTHFDLIDKLVVLEIIDELEMSINKKPTMRDVTYMANKYGITKPARVISLLLEEGFVEREGIKLGRSQK